jgi:hypothetical protein
MVTKFGSLKASEFQHNWGLSRFTGLLALFGIEWPQQYALFQLHRSLPNQQSCAPHAKRGVCCGQTNQVAPLLCSKTARPRLTLSLISLTAHLLDAGYRHLVFQSRVHVPLYIAHARKRFTRQQAY